MNTPKAFVIPPFSRRTVEVEVIETQGDKALVRRADRKMFERDADGTAIQWRQMWLPTNQIQIKA